MSTSCQYEVVLLGKMGSGKSATGNTLLGRKTFSLSHTSVVQWDSVCVSGMTLKVCDTPGFFDPERSNDDIEKQCQSLFWVNLSVTTVILLVMKIDRFTQEEKSTVELIEKLVPEWLRHNIWILFTRGDELESEGLSIEQLIEEADELERVIQRFSNRYHVFNNIQTQNCDQVSSLMKKILANTRLKLYTPLDKNIQLVSRHSDLDPYDEDMHVLRAVLSCGHVTGPETLTDYCKVLIDRGEATLTCPLCQREWPYVEVRQLAKLTPEEAAYFEEKLEENFMEKYTESVHCPGCESFIERSNPSDLCVQCTVCCKKTGRNYEFCCQCLKEWKGPHPRSDRCDNEGCTNRALQILLNCETIILPQVQNRECPSVRACPTCGILIEHSTEKCKNIVCNRCNKEFCFLCLKLKTECLKTSSHFKPCSDGVAQRQTSIPSWNN